MKFSKNPGTIYIHSHCFSGEILVSNWPNELSSRQTIEAKYTASTDGKSNKHCQDEHPTEAVCLVVVRTVASCRSRHLYLSTVWAARGWGSLWAAGSRVYPNLRSMHLGKAWSARQVCNNLGLLFGCHISAAGTLTTQSRVTLGVSAKVDIWHMPLSMLPPQVTKFTEFSEACWEICSLMARLPPCSNDFPDTQRRKASLRKETEGFYWSISGELVQESV